ncbi:UDP-3-O-(3-hydroxymyristoyl)glucosamine N-acyltransferase [Thiospirillum jenense]|uniref:UDP-3-O-acylglucosamine N-acyltransferase n=1 Tax=Thiospirillum jenense TaxID=1653858 RepID=A0A839HE55_9GAMM|nr:UDP-3-O-(3-hydroxymyristoyl)glucosamine N-acyltransferase [Thiospirillum jenense]
MATTLGQLANWLNLELHGNTNTLVKRVATLERALPDCLSFYGDVKYRTHLTTTKAAAVIIKPADISHCPAAALITDNPYLAIARAIGHLHPRPRLPMGCHSTAVIAASARIDATAAIGPFCVIEDEVDIGARVELGPGCIVRTGAKIGADTQLVAQVVICEHSCIGERVLIHPGAIIGRQGFGFAKDGNQWVRIPQIGRACLGNDVEVGANTSIDCGAIDDTLIGDGVKLDSFVHISHNVQIGEHTAIAGCTGIAGSTRIGRYCTVAGEVGIAGHLNIADNIHFTGMAMVTRSLSQPGVYSSGIPIMPNQEWRRTVVRFRQLEQLTQRIKILEAQLNDVKQYISDTPSHNNDE